MTEQEVVVLRLLEPLLRRVEELESKVAALSPVVIPLPSYPPPPESGSWPSYQPWWQQVAPYPPSLETARPPALPPVWSSVEVNDCDVD